MLHHYVFESGLGDFSVSNNARIINDPVMSEAFRALFVGLFIITQPVALREAPRL